MLYTMRVKCFDGVVRTFEQTGYFAEPSILRHHLACWNGARGPAGEPYEYFETAQQALHNDGACCLSKADLNNLPYGTLLYFGNCQHHYSIAEGAGRRMEQNPF
jgi:hypothetical protein